MSFQKDPNGIRIHIFRIFNVILVVLPCCYFFFLPHILSKLPKTPKENSILLLAASQVSELSTWYSQGSLLKEGFGIEMIGVGTSVEGERKGVEGKTSTEVGAKKGEQEREGNHMLSSRRDGTL